MDSSLSCIVTQWLQVYNLCAVQWITCLVQGVPKPTNKCKHITLVTPIGTIVGVVEIHPTTRVGEITPSSKRLFLQDRIQTPLHASLQLYQHVEDGSQLIVIHSQFRGTRAAAQQFGVAWTYCWHPLNFMMTCVQRNRIVMWDTPKCIEECVKQFLVPDCKVINTIAWNKPGTQLAIGTNDPFIRIWDGVSAMDGNSMRFVVGHTRAVWAVEWNPQVSRCQLASGSRDHTIRIWDTTSYKTSYVLRTSGPVICVRWTANGAWLASCSSGTIRIWETTMWAQVHTFYEGIIPRYPELSWNSDGTRLASLIGSNIQIWNTVLGVEDCTLHGPDDSVTTIQWSPDGTMLASGSRNNTIRIWDMTTESAGYRCDSVRAHTGRITSVAWDSSSTQLVSGSYDGFSYIWR